MPDPFITLAPDTQAEELAVEHIIREHHLGRSLAEILDDEAVSRRCSDAQIARLLDRPEGIRAVGDDLLEPRRSMPARSRGAERPVD